MKFLVDAHLPPNLCVLLQASGHEAVHTSQLSAKNRTPDEVINELSLQEQRVVMSKDSDFFHSHLLHGKPWKLLLVRTGNIRARDLKTLFQIQPIDFRCAGRNSRLRRVLCFTKIDRGLTSLIN